VKIVLEPVFEADFLPCSFGFRPKRSAHDALQVLIDESWQGRRWVVETDIASCFSAIPHDKLMQALEERISDQGVLKLLRVMLRAGVMEDGRVRREVTGTPQGGLCAAAHKPPYAQCRIMRSAGLAGLVGAGSASERCA
jgi:RNA-directed DNA polymerase